MAKNSGLGMGSVWIVVAIVLIIVLMKLVSAVGAVGVLLLVVVIGGGIVGLIVFLRIQRRKELMERYGDEQIVNAILAKNIWQGQTVEQLIDSIGRPVDLDQKLLKTKKKI